jgi:AcrR family transcriptional regulator
MTSTRDRLVRAATALLDRGGPEVVTLREVGHRAGVSHNAPYKHFSDKSALLAAVAANELRSLERRLVKARTGAADPVAAIASAGVAYVKWAAAHPMRFKLTFGTLATSDPELGAAATAARLEFIRPFLDASREGALAGAPPELAALLVWTLAHGATDLDLTGHLRKDGTTTSPETLVGALVKLLTST